MCINRYSICFGGQGSCSVSLKYLRLGQFKCYDLPNRNINCSTLNHLVQQRRVFFHFFKLSPYENNILRYTQRNGRVSSCFKMSQLMTDRRCSQLQLPESRTTSSYQQACFQGEDRKSRSNLKRMKQMCVIYKRQKKNKNRRGQRSTVISTTRKWETIFCAG